MNSSDQNESKGTEEHLVEASFKVGQSTGAEPQMSEGGQPSFFAVWDLRAY